MPWVWWANDYATTAQVASLHGDILQFRADLLATIAAARTDLTQRITAAMSAASSDADRIITAITGVQTDVDRVVAQTTNLAQIMTDLRAMITAGGDPAAIAKMDQAAAMAETLKASADAMAAGLDAAVTAPPTPPTP